MNEAYRLIIRMMGWMVLVVTLVFAYSSGELDISSAIQLGTFLIASVIMIK